MKDNQLIKKIDNEQMTKEDQTILLAHSFRSQIILNRNNPNFYNPFGELSKKRFSLLANTQTYRR